ncbi:MAG: hypothetical protein PHV03_10820 [Desulfitobacteriaceae bacterium]|nr:hypothetical protein [Desulfitobacteriaceae bacterium]MDD4297204.1 hypothetical protein [Ruminiclostridium sp.]
MSDFMAEYPDLIEAYKKIPQQTDLRTEFETQWSKVNSFAIDGKNKAIGDLTAQVKEMETLIRSLTEPFSKSSEEKRVAPHTLMMPKVKLLRSSTIQGGITDGEIL